MSETETQPPEPAEEPEEEPTHGDETPE